MRKTAIRLSKVKVGNGQRLWCVTWPRIGKGRNRQFFKDKTEAETVYLQKLVEQENQGRAGLSFNERQRAEYQESMEKLRPFEVFDEATNDYRPATIRDAVNFYLPHLSLLKHTKSAADECP